jgi:BirA family biotin operon repressor/biotin-[acetyl-CoA-carboxylase] ligase
VTGSTNADLVAAALTGELAGLVLVADEQTAGRGRLGRSWSAPAGSGLAVSVLLRPAVAANRLGWLPLVTGLAVVDAVRDSAGLAVGLKWPNDVVVGPDGRKLAGILAERVGGTDAVVVGVGLNVAMTAEQLPVPTATSLALELAPAEPPAVDDVLAALLARLGARVGAWAVGDDQAGEYRAACVTLGRDVRVDLPARGVLEGRAVDVDDTGRLLVDVGGRVEPVAAGDVTEAGGTAEA